MFWPVVIMIINAGYALLKLLCILMVIYASYIYIRNNKQVR